ncbi:hypothetical protein GN958_ATG21517 [Phytophthora infestans]|uniref:Uncharacterized protein n=1 Tax=Phytophthora infestans TaxID=4787 RepID=A0A8S9TMN7_PHYIN|nr:hypothetical protein GN958_ATG21517 [Phytophthora infestans]
MGTAITKAIAEGTWSREDVIITTKTFYGSNGFPEGPFGKRSEKRASKVSVATTSWKAHLGRGRDSGKRPSQYSINWVAG